MRQYATAYAALKADNRKVCACSHNPQREKARADKHAGKCVDYLVLESVHCTSYIITHYVLHVNNKNEMSKECQ